MPSPLDFSMTTAPTDRDLSNLPPADLEALLRSHIRGLRQVLGFPRPGTHQSLIGQSRA
jgi:hypothetical protein